MAKRMSVVVSLPRRPSTVSADRTHRRPIWNQIGQFQFELGEDWRSGSGCVRMGQLVAALTETTENGDARTKAAYTRR